ncbi:hypothetical protein COU56_01035, partial [Candidatus Pacearchaeota archaeon CG10_big_fil_rev_8_21_14_0_10_31_9]
MKPKVEFRFSEIYDSLFKENYSYEKEWGKYPNASEIKNYIKKIEIKWKEIGNLILKEISDISGLTWQEDKIICYVIGKTIPFSDPLTVPVYEDEADYIIDVITHELIHQIFIQNEGKLKNYWEYIGKKYSKENPVTKIHIILHAIHKTIYLKLFDEARLKRDIEWISDIEEYKRSWEIVKKEGHKNIIKEFK